MTNELNLKNYKDLKDPNEIEGYFRLFSFIEFGILQILFYNRGCLTIKEIRSLFVNGLFNSQTHKHSDTPDIRVSRFDLSDEKAKSMYSEYKKATDKKDLEPYQNTNLKISLLSKYGIKTPSYLTIENILENLKEMEITFKREPRKDSKAKGYWGLNPKFYAIISQNPPDFAFRSGSLISSL